MFLQVYLLSLDPKTMSTLEITPVEVLLTFYLIGPCSKTGILLSDLHSTSSP